MSGLAVRLRGVSHAYAVGPDRVTALREVDLDVPAGAAHVVVGPSGSGKSTLLHLLGGLARPTSGELFAGPYAVHALSSGALRAMRGGAVAVLVQSPGQSLLPWATARQNVELVRRGRGRAAARAARAPEELLDRLGLRPVADRAVARLSGGEQQRVAIAAALVHRPGLLLADEPTSALDPAARGAVMTLLDEVRRESGATLLLTTHDPALLQGADGVSELRDGRLGPA